MLTEVCTKLASILANYLLETADIGKSFEVLSHSPAYEETYINPTARPLPPVGIMPTGVNLSSNRRTVSDPFGDLGGLSSRARTERLGDTFAQSGGQPAHAGGK